MILNKHFYPDKQWLNSPHRIEPSGEYTEDPFTGEKIFTGEYEGSILAHFLQGNRKAGKSVGVGIFLIADFLLYGYQFVLIRRFANDFDKDKAMETFIMQAWPFREQFPKIVKQHPKLQRLYPLELVENFDFKNHELEFKSNKCYIDGKIVGYPAILHGKGPTQFKQSGPYTEVHKVIYDEYIPELDAPQIPDEIRKWAIIFETACRGREDALRTTAAIFISNVVTHDNLWAKAYRFKEILKADDHFFCKNPERGYTLELVHNKAVSEEMDQSALATFLRGSAEGTAYLDYSQANISQDNMSFVEQIKSSTFRYLFNIKYCDKTYAMKYDLDNQLYYFTDDGVDAQFKNSYAVTRADHSLDTKLITSILRQRMSIIKMMYGSGQMRFNSIVSKNVFMDIYPLI